jgi:hypothetical protein
LPLLREVAGFLAGANQVPWRPFLAANAVGALFWSAVFGYGAYGIGRGAENTGRSVEVGLGLLAVIVFIAGADVSPPKRASATRGRRSGAAWCTPVVKRPNWKNGRTHGTSRTCVRLCRGEVEVVHRGTKCANFSAPLLPLRFWRPLVLTFQQWPPQQGQVPPVPLRRLRQSLLRRNRACDVQEYGELQHACVVQE